VTAGTEKVVLADVLFLEVNGVGMFVYRGSRLPEGLSDERVAALETKGLAGVLPVEGGVAVTPVVPEGDPSESWTVAQIDAYLVDHALPVTGRKSEKLAAIEAAREFDREPADDTTENTDALGFITPNDVTE
jgi:hypothetical protein